MADAPRVFISYSHDSEEHARPRSRQLAKTPDAVICRMLNKTRYQRNAVQSLAAQLGIAPLFLPTVLTRTNLIARPREARKRCALSRTRVDADPSY